MPKKENEYITARKELTAMGLLCRALNPDGTLSLKDGSQLWKLRENATPAEEAAWQAEYGERLQ
jgi:hypothetical protein